MSPELLSPETLIVLSLGLPLLGAAAVGATGRWPNLRDSLTVVVAVLTTLCVVGLLQSVRSGDRPELVLFEVFDGVALGFRLEPLGALFGLVASGLWILTSLYAFGYMRGHHEKHQTRFFVCFALAIAAALGVAFASNLFTLFLCYELLTFSTYPLVTHHQTPEAKKAGRTYLGILVGTSVSLFLLAVIWTWWLAGTTELARGGILPEDTPEGVVVILLALYAFGIGKAALMPFHRWLPAAMVAPTPVSALLHAVAVVKAGVFSVLKILIYVFGSERLLAMGKGWLAGSGWLMIVASFTLIAASVVAMRQDNLKRRLAYSTISQLAYIVLGAALATRAGFLGGGLHVLTHAVGKITLFFCAGAIYVAAHKTEISDMKGLGRRMPVTMTAFLVASLSIIGVPPLAGMWSKWYLFLGALERDAWWVLVVLSVSSLLNIAYLLPIPMNAFFAKPDESDDHGSSDGGVHEAPWLCTAPLAATAILCLVLFFAIDPFLELLEGLP